MLVAPAGTQSHQQATISYNCYTARASIGRVPRPSPHLLNDPARLQALVTSALLDTEPEPVFERFTRAAALLTRAPAALISLLDAERQYMKSSFGEAAAGRLTNQTTRQFSQHVVTHNRPLLVDDTQKRRTPAAETGIQAYAGAPIHCDGEPIGALCVVSEQPRRWGPHDLEALEALALAIDSEIALRVTRRELDSISPRADTPLDGALRAADEQLRLTVDLSPIGTALVLPDGHWLRVNDAICSLLGYTREELLRTDFQSVTHPDDLQADMAMAQQLLAGKINSYQLEKRYIHHQGHNIWILLTVSLVRTATGEPSFFISQVQDISDRRKLEEEIREASLQDELTGLQNRRGFMMLGNQALMTASRYKRGLVLLFADLNGLKTINDELGHEAGDRAIMAMAETMRTTFRRADIIARLGGDEFVFLGEGDDSFVVTAEHKLQAAIAVHNQRTAGPYPLSASIGAIARPVGSSATLQELMAAADARMYSAKRQHKAAARPSEPK